MAYAECPFSGVSGCRWWSPGVRLGAGAAGVCPCSPSWRGAFAASPTLMTTTVLRAHIPPRPLGCVGACGSLSFPPRPLGCVGACGSLSFPPRPLGCVGACGSLSFPPRPLGCVGACGSLSFPPRPLGCVGGCGSLSFPPRPLGCVGACGSLSFPASPRVCGRLRVVVGSCPSSAAWVIAGRRRLVSSLGCVGDCGRSSAHVSLGRARAAAGRHRPLFSCSPVPLGVAFDCGRCPVPPCPYPDISTPSNGRVGGRHPARSGGVGDTAG